MSEESSAVAQSAPSQEASNASQSHSDSSNGASGVYEHRIGSQTSDQQPRGSDEAQQRPKELSRYERTKRERAQFKAEREAFQRERMQFQRERQAAAEAAKPKRDYTVEELKKYRRQWERSGEDDLVQKADAEIAAMEAEAEAERRARTVEIPRGGTPQHRAIWEQCEANLRQSDPDFLREGSPLDTKIREILAGPNGQEYINHPYGIIAAYDRAKHELLEAGVHSLQTELSRAKEELKRYHGLTSIDGGAPSGIGNGRAIESIEDFRRLPLKDMRAHLLAGARRKGASWF